MIIVIKNTISNTNTKTEVSLNTNTDTNVKTGTSNKSHYNIITNTKQYTYL